MANESYMLSAEAVAELRTMREEVALLRDFIANIRGPNVRRTPRGITIGAVQSSQQGPPTDHVHWFKITSKYDNAGAGKGYSWVRASCDTSGIKSVPNSDDTGSYLFDINGNKGLMDGQYVRAVQTSKAADDSPIYLIIPAIPHATFPVNVSQVGGTDGDSTDAATWTYNVKTIDDAYTLASAQTPAWARASKGPMVKATHGTGYYTAGGTFVLYQVDEQEDSNTCTTSSG